MPTPGSKQPERPRHPSDDPARVGTGPRDHAVSSGDRNTKDGEHDWPGFEGGTQRVAVPDAPRDPRKRPDRA